jgi:hypothetical protein
MDAYGSPLFRTIPTLHYTIQFHGVLLKHPVALILLVYISMYKPVIRMFTNPVPVDIVNSLSENKSHCFSGVNKR